MKYLVTGVTGFAGPHLAKLLLSEGHEVHGLLRSYSGQHVGVLDVLSVDEFESITWHSADLRDYSSLISVMDGTGFDGIFHLAAQSHPPTSFANPVLTFSENVMGSVHLITATTRYSPETKLMFCSTSEVYGDTCKEVGVLKTDARLQPSNPYGASKTAVDLYMQERMKNGFVKGYVTRAFSHTGPRRGKDFSISSDAYQIAKMSLGLQDETLRIGNLETERVVIDVRDCVRAYYLLMIHPDSSGRVFNVCGSTLRKMRFFTDELVRLSKLEGVEYKIDEKLYRPIDIQMQIGDCAELVELTGWKPEIPIEVTLQDLYDYWLAKLSRGEVGRA